MSHGIEEIDKGFVWGTTWHKIKSYITQNFPVTIEQAREVMCYPLEKQQLHRGTTHEVTGSTVFPKVDAWCITRTDTDTVLVPHVGKKFTVLDNSFLLDFVNEHLLCQYPDLQIESVGTLFSGATAFVNLKVDEFQVKGDKSPTLSRLMYYNPLGQGSYKACAHDIRIVCNNTLQMAERQGAVNSSLAKFRHTASAAERINEHLVNLAEIKLGLSEHIEQLNMLAEKRLVSEQVEQYLDMMYPLPVDDNGKPIEGRSRTIATNKREEIANRFYSDQRIDPADSAYALLQATTNWLDHGNIKGGDGAACQWDGIIGQRAKTKNKALAVLVEV